MASSQFAPGELRSIIIAWVVISVAISIGAIYGYISTGASPVYAIVSSLIASATAFIFHEMGHKFVAIRHGYVAHFQMWTWGIVLTLITAIVSRGSFLFGAPGAVYIAPAAAAGYYGYGYYSSNQRTSNPDKENAVISFAGPGINLGFALLFLGLLIFAPINEFAIAVESLGFTLNVGLGSFNMIPIPPLDGYKIFRGSIPIALAIALPLWGMFLYFIIVG